VDDFWQNFRNGILHSALIYGDYALSPARVSSVILVRQGSHVVLFVWQFRNKVVEVIEREKNKLWTQGEQPFPEVWRV